MKRIPLLLFVTLPVLGCGGPATPTPDVIATLVAEELAVAAPLTAWVPTGTPSTLVATLIPPAFTPISPTATPTTRPPPTVTPTAARGTDVNARDSQGFTQLWWAVL